jgi:hypothetical protein
MVVGFIPFFLLAATLPFFMPLRLTLSSRFFALPPGLRLLMLNSPLIHRLPRRQSGRPVWRHGRTLRRNRWSLRVSPARRRSFHLFFRLLWRLFMRRSRSWWRHWCTLRRH